MEGHLTVLINVFLLGAFAINVGCDHFPTKQESEIKLLGGISTEKAFSKINECATAAGFAAIDCKPLKFRTEDSSYAAVTGSIGLRYVPATEAACFKKETKFQGSPIYLVATKRKTDLIFTEMWIPAGRESVMLSTLADFWHRIGRDSKLESKIIK